MSENRNTALDVPGRLLALNEDSKSRRRALNTELVIMAQQLAKVGPNINEIARRTSQYKESVRYRYHKFFIEKGISLQAIMSYPKLGFRRLVLILRLAPECEANARAIFDALNNLCYLRSFTRVMLTGEYVVHVAVPCELARECASVYTALQKAGLFKELEILEFEEMRNPPMKPDSYDFVRGAWSFDWKSAGTRETRLAQGGTQKVEKYDKVDLLILKELDIDASRKLVKMAENVGVNLNALEFHYREHVQARGLISGYRLVWQGSRFERAWGVPREDTYIELTILLKDGTQAEVAELMLLLRTTPFLWSESRGPTYCAEVFLPNYAYTDFLKYIDKFASDAGQKLRIFVMDQSRAVRFVISYPLFNAESKKWQLNSRAVLRTLGRLAPATSLDFA